MSLIITRLETSIYRCLYLVLRRREEEKRNIITICLYTFYFSMFLRATATLKIGYVLPVIVLIEEIGCEQLGCILEPWSTAMTRTRGGLFGFRTTSIITCLSILLKPKFSYSTTLYCYNFILYIFIIF